MGLISGFLGAAGKATADAGRMLFTDKIAREREEANFLRDSALKGSMATEEREFKTSERESGQEFKSSEAGKRDVAAMERTRASARAKSKQRPQKIKYTDSKGFEQEGILHELGDGKYKIVKPETDEVISEKITSAELKDMAAVMNVAEGKGSDWIPWNEYGKRDPEVRAAVIKKREAKKGGGIIDGAMGKPDMPETPKPSKEVKTIGKKQMSKQEYIDAMVAKYGEDKRNIIEKQWSDYK